MSWGPLTQILTVLADVIAMGALGLTGDVYAWVFLVPLCIGVMRYVFRWSWIPDRFLFPGMALLIGVAAYFALSARLHPLLVAAHLAVILHALLWWSRSDSRNQAIRIGMGFVDLAIAGAINPDFQTGAVIFLYMVVASVSVSCQYIAQEFREKSPELLKRRVPRDFLSTSTGIALVTFIASLALFPILPRTQEGVNWGANLGALSRTGYTEEVSLGTQRRWGSEDQKPAVRLLLGSEAEDPKFQRWIPYGLLRGRALDLFDGKSWKPGAQNLSRESVAQQKYLGQSADPRIYSATFEVIRESLGSSVLPVPYLTRLVYSTEGSGETGQFRRSLSGDWNERGARERRQTHYRVELNSSSRLVQSPVREHLEVRLDWSKIDPSYQERWIRLQENLFRAARTPAEKIEKVKAYFLSGAFKTHQEDGEESGKSNEEIHPALNLSQFVFERRSGHCELFATAAALLLRSANVPSRLVSGFRVSKGPVGEVLTLRQSDAHAWVEAWDPARGWIPLDATPLVASMGFGVMDWARGVMDTASVYWSIYVVGFESGRLRVQARDFFGEVARDFRELPKQSWSGLKVWMERSGGLIFALIAFLALVVVFALKVQLRFGRRGGLGALRVRSRGLERRRKRAEAWLRKKGSESAVFLEWKRAYERVRFGADPVTRERIEELDRLWGRVVA
jgi:hypothetical protein